ncbi:MAG: hypothetical protein LUC17_00010 [Oscillospiraceae bacterium]|nr:hypothetical protein [Oscillospiraceae bacterium]
MRFTKIPEATFQQLQLNAGILLDTFDASMGKEELNEHIIGATSGGVNFSATPTYSDFGEDIDNCPVNVKELKKLDSWSVTMSGTFVTINEKLAKRLIGAADFDEEDETKIVPRNDVNSQTDFEDIWWVGDYSDSNDEITGGYVAIHMLNSLSTGGFSSQSGNREKDQFAFEFTGHYSIEDQDKVPFEIWIVAGETANNDGDGGDPDDDGDGNDGDGNDGDDGGDTEPDDENP